MEPLTLAYLLIAVGLVLLVAELFIPSGGALTVVAVICEIAGVVMVFYHGQTITGLITLAVVLIGIPILGSFLMNLWPHTPVGKRLVLQRDETDDATLASMPSHLELEDLRGRIGRTLSSMRPSGTVDFDGRRIDAVTEGMMIDPGQYVRCIDVKAGRVIVRLIDRPTNLEDFEETDFDENLL